MMDNITRKVNLLILRGVYLKDLDTPEDTPSIQCGANKQHTGADAPAEYTEIPKRFTCVKNWPISSNLKCWSCDLLPPSYPKFIPLNPEKGEDNRDECDTYGNFCEWNCAVEYVRKEFPPDQHWDILEDICLFESKFSGQRKEKIVPAPPKIRMAMYCGKHGLTPKEWREELHRLNNEYSVARFRIDLITRDIQ